MSLLISVGARRRSVWPWRCTLEPRRHTHRYFWCKLRNVCVSWPLSGMGGLLRIGWHSLFQLKMKTSLWSLRATLNSLKSSLCEVEVSVSPEEVFSIVAIKTSSTSLSRFCLPFSITAVAQHCQSHSSKSKEGNEGEKGRSEKIRKTKTKDEGEDMKRIFRIYSPIRFYFHFFS